MEKMENGFSPDSNSCSEDMELLISAQHGDTAAEEKLIIKYSRLVRICARPLFLAGGDSEDLIQEGMIGLMNAISHFDLQKNTSFSSFAESCIRNRLFSAIKSAARFKHTPLNDYVSLESPQFDESTACGFCSSSDPEDIFIAKERFSELTRRLKDALSDFEAKVLGLYLDGLSYTEIAVKINKSPKSVDNAVQRIRKKLTQSIIIGDIQ